MGNAKDPKKDQAVELLQQGVSPAEVARRLDIPPATARTWKNRLTKKPESVSTVSKKVKRSETPCTEDNTIVLCVAPEKEKPKGKPRNKYNIADMVVKIDEYIEKTKAEGKHPILKECCLENDWTYDYVMQLQREHEALSQSIKKLLAWKEVMIERGTLAGDYDKTMAIFILKQPAHGWSDKPVSKEGIELEDLTPLTEMLKDDKATDDPVEDVQPKA